MTDADLAAHAESESTVLRDRILTEIDIDRADKADVATRALANALVAAVQEYLGRHSIREDVDLFFEVHGRTPEDLASWPAMILADLSRHQISSEARRVICDGAVRKAVSWIRASSPLAYG